MCLHRDMHQDMDCEHIKAMSCDLQRQRRHQQLLRRSQLHDAKSGLFFCVLMWVSRLGVTPHLRVPSLPTSPSVLRVLWVPRMFFFIWLVLPIFSRGYNVQLESARWELKSSLDDTACSLYGDLRRRSVRNSVTEKVCTYAFLFNLMFLIFLMSLEDCLAWCVC